MELNEMEIEDINVIQESNHEHELVKVTDFPFDKVYVGSDKDFGDDVIKMEKSELFVTPYIGIASIFTTDRSLYKIPRKRSINIGYDEWSSKDLSKPFKEIHVVLEGAPEIEPFSFNTVGYIYEIDVKDLKDHLYRKSWMSKIREVLIRDVNDVKISKKIKWEHTCHVRGAERDDIPVTESASLKDSIMTMIQESSNDDEEYREIIDRSDYPDELFVYVYNRSGKYEICYTTYLEKAMLYCIEICSKNKTIKEIVRNIIEKDFSTKTGHHMMDNNINIELSKKGYTVNIINEEIIATNITGYILRLTNLKEQLSQLSYIKTENIKMPPNVYNVKFTNLKDNKDIEIFKVDKHDSEISINKLNKVLATSLIKESVNIMDKNNMNVLMSNDEFFQEMDDKKSFFGFGNKAKRNASILDKFFSEFNFTPSETLKNDILNEHSYLFKKPYGLQYYFYNITSINNMVRHLRYDKNEISQLKSDIIKYKEFNPKLPDILCPIGSIMMVRDFNELLNERKKFGDDPYTDYFHEQLWKFVDIFIDENENVYTTIKDLSGKKLDKTASSIKEFMDNFKTYTVNVPTDKFTVKTLDSNKNDLECVIENHTKVLLPVFNSICLWMCLYNDPLRSVYGAQDEVVDIIIDDDLNEFGIDKYDFNDIMWRGVVINNKCNLIKKTYKNPKTIKIDGYGYPIIPIDYEIKMYDGDIITIQTENGNVINLNNTSSKAKNIKEMFDLGIITEQERINLLNRIF